MLVAKPFHGPFPALAAFNERTNAAVFLRPSLNGRSKICEQDFKIVTGKLRQIQNRTAPHHNL